MSSDVDSQFQAAPDSEFVEGVPQVVLHYLLRGANGSRNLTVGQSFPDQCRDLQLLCG